MLGQIEARMQMATTLREQNYDKLICRWWAVIRLDPDTEISLFQIKNLLNTLCIMFHSGTSFLMLSFKDSLQGVLKSFRS
jgi:hypothetical protein